MARLPETAELVALLYRADWTTLSLSATVRQQSDRALQMRLSHERAARIGRWPPFGRPSWWPFPWPGEDDDPAGREPWPAPADDGDDDGGDGGEGPRGESQTRILIAPGGRYRLSDPGGEPPLWLCDGEWVYGVSEGRAERSPADGRHGGPGLLRPGRLLPAHDFTVTGTVQAGGRTAYRVTARPRPGLDPSAARLGELHDELLLLVDASLGILLRSEERAGGEQLSLDELADLVLDPPEAADPAQFRPPAGMPVTDAAPLFGAGVTLPGLPGQAARAAAGLVSSALGFAIRHAPLRSPPSAGGEAMPAPAIPVSWQPVSDEQVNLLHRTGLPAPDLTAEVHQWTDGRVAIAAMAQFRAALPPAFAGAFGPDAVWDAWADRMPDVTREVLRLQVAPGGRFRLDRAGGDSQSWRTFACDGGQVRRVYRDRIATGPAGTLAGALPNPYPSLLDPAWSLDAFVLTTGGHMEIAGRRGILLRARHQGAGWEQAARAGAARFGRLLVHPSHAVPPVLPGQGDTELVVDAGLGIVLRMLTLVDGQVAACYELRDVSAGTDPEAFSVEVPPGTRTVRAGALNEMGTLTPVTAVKTAAGLGAMGLSALAGWVQKRPSQPPPGEPGGGPDRG